MGMDADNGDDLQRPWRGCADDPGIVDAVRRSLCDRHPLHGADLTLLAYRHDQEDLLCRIEDGSGRVAVVHPTWQYEEDPRWPSCRVFVSFADFLVRGHDPVVREYRAVFGDGDA